ncbi:unnamed protein product [Phytophthora lilii]|uniref:Unnamed protein product n=1 Tax=Phytophthora lilii TaxID=2077276 RepID=A0A9W6WRP3_9STRA|nr:unnamed protein product [Phytophthora lilii]
MDGAAVVKWLHKHCSEGWTICGMDGAIRNGHLNVVEWLKNNVSDSYSFQDKHGDSQIEPNKFAFEPDAKDAARSEMEFRVRLEEKTRIQAEEPRIRSEVEAKIRDEAREKICMEEREKCERQQKRKESEKKKKPSFGLRSEPKKKHLQKRGFARKFRKPWRNSCVLKSELNFSRRQRRLARSVLAIPRVRRQRSVASSFVKRVC